MCLCSMVLSTCTRIIVATLMQCGIHPRLIHSHTYRSKQSNIQEATSAQLSDTITPHNTNVLVLYLSQFLKQSVALMT